MKIFALTCFVLCLLTVVLSLQTESESFLTKGKKVTKFSQCTAVHYNAKTTQVSAKCGKKALKIKLSKCKSKKSKAIAKKNAKACAKNKVSKKQVLSCGKKLKINLTKIVSLGKKGLKC